MTTATFAETRPPTPLRANDAGLGRALLGYDRRTVPRLNWNVLLHADITWIFHPIDSLHKVFGHHAFWPRLFSFLVGTTILAIFIGFAAYGIVHALLQLYHRRHPRVAIRAARRRTGTSGEFQKEELKMEEGRIED